MTYKDKASCTEEPLIIRLFCGKWPVKMRHPMGLGNPVHLSCARVPARTRYALIRAWCTLCVHCTAGGWGEGAPHECRYTCLWSLCTRDLSHICTHLLALLNTYVGLFYVSAGGRMLHWVNVWIPESLRCIHFLIHTCLIIVAHTRTHTLRTHITTHILLRTHSTDTWWWQIGRRPYVTLNQRVDSEISRQSRWVRRVREKRFARHERPQVSRPRGPAHKVRSRWADQETRRRYLDVQVLFDVVWNDNASLSRRARVCCVWPVCVYLGVFGTPFFSLGALPVFWRVFYLWCFCVSCMCYVCSYRSMSFPHTRSTRWVRLVGSIKYQISHIHTYKNVHLCVYAYIYMYIYMNMHISLYICIYTHIHKHMYICTYIYVLYICIYMYCILSFPGPQLCLASEPG